LNLQLFLNLLRPPAFSFYAGVFGVAVDLALPGIANLLIGEPRHGLKTRRTGSLKS
jgi:hypothetical protein